MPLLDWCVRACVHVCVCARTSTRTRVCVQACTHVCVCVCVCMRAQLLSHIQLFVTQCTVACWAPLSMGFSKQEYWGGLPFPTPGDLPDPGMEPVSPALAGEFFPSEAPGKPAWLTCLLSPSLLLRSSYNTTFGAQTATKVSSSSLCIKHIVTPRIYIHTTFKNV